MTYRERVWDFLLSMEVDDRFEIKPPRVQHKEAFISSVKALIEDIPFGWNYFVLGPNHEYVERINHNEEFNLPEI